MIRLCIIFGVSDSILVAGELNFRIPNANHEWIRRPNSASEMEVGLDINRSWVSGDREFLIGYLGFDTEERRN